MKKKIELWACFNDGTNLGPNFVMRLPNGQTEFMYTSGDWEKSGLDLSYWYSIDNLKDYKFEFLGYL